MATSATVDVVLYPPTQSPALNVFQALLPWFHFLRLFSRILQVTKVEGWNESLGGSRSDLKSSYFGWDQLFAIENSTTVNPDRTSTVNFYPPLFTSIINLFCLCTFYIFLSWYISVVVHRSQPLWFFVTKEFWGARRERKAFEAGDTIRMLQEKSRENRSVILHFLSKAFESNTAVKELSFEMHNNQCFCLLGENGSGKTTTINVGALPYTYRVYYYVFLIQVSHSRTSNRCLRGFSLQLVVTRSSLDLILLTTSLIFRI